MNLLEQPEEYYGSSFKIDQKLKKSLAAPFGLSHWGCGGHVIRNERDWRENEKSVEYVWIVGITACFTGWRGIYSIKFAESKFREHSNPEELVQGLFTTHKGRVAKVFAKSMFSNFPDPSTLFKLDLFHPRNSHMLDGVSYQISIENGGVESFIEAINPNTPAWQIWEKEIWSLGSKLVEASGEPDFTSFFAGK